MRVGEAIKHLEDNAGVPSAILECGGLLSTVPFHLRTRAAMLRLATKVACLPARRPAAVLGVVILRWESWGWVNHRWAFFLRVANYPRVVSQDKKSE